MPQPIQVMALRCSVFLAQMRDTDKDKKPLFLAHEGCWRFQRPSKQTGELLSWDLDEVETTQVDSSLCLERTRGPSDTGCGDYLNGQCQKGIGGPLVHAQKESRKFIIWDQKMNIEVIILLF